MKFKKLIPKIFIREINNVLALPYYIMLVHLTKVLPTLAYVYYDLSENVTLRTLENHLGILKIL